VSTIEAEDNLLDVALTSLQEDGFDIYRRPPPHMLPPFMGGYRPDAIAIGQGRKIAIDVIVEGANVARATEAKDRFRDQKGWEHRVIYARPVAASKALQGASASAIEASLATVDRLNEAGFLSAALLTGWATFEALGRRLCPDQFRRPQTPARLVEVLASEGQLTPDEADNMRQLIDLRNRLTHGDLEIEVPKQSVDCLTRILHTLLKQVTTDAGD
jgi:hypothetical protein